ncbi:primary-amine oxidase [Arthrobacter castelli]|uniref:primary-amine oxidase n=1 Tax=Arthrobacter castelli TaxID=271431 RepID=UPI00041E4E77|nr:primary-amine oxidase [Arthrobacter castelli]
MTTLAHDISIGNKHPLDRLTGAEIEANRQILVAAGYVTDQTRFTLVSLLEPEKNAVLAHGAAAPAPRLVRSLLLERNTGEVTEITASLNESAVVSARTVDVIGEGQPPIIAEEFELAEEMIRRDPRWRAAMESRGVTDMSLVRICALSAGCFDIPGEEGRRLIRGSSFVQLDENDNAWAHPVEGLVAYLDLNTGEVVDLIETDALPIPQQRFNFHLDEGLPPARTTQKPIEISQPEGPSFTIDGDVLTWEKWQVRLGFDPVEGLVLHQLGFEEDGRVRPIIYRASIAEMVVPYGDPSPVRFWQNYFDAGEYSLGKSANSLKLGCDCLGEIHYEDAVLADALGHASTIENAICMHEEDAGVLWKHTDEYTGSVDVRRQRRMVISFFVTVGNYDYGFYWYLYLDGTIELECKATGVVYTAAYDDSNPSRFASRIGEGIGAPYHQHLFSARLDMQVDGTQNAVDEIQVQRVPTGPENPYGNAFTRSVSRLDREPESGRLADNTEGRVWQVSNPGRTNSHGEPVGYVLRPEGQPPLLADDGSSISRRASFATRHLWVTAYDPDERFPSGTYVNQNPGNGTITDWVKQDRTIDGADIVLWHNFGMTHFPRPEDWPIMPVDSCGFVLKPQGFFDQNPTLDVPRPVSGHCATDAQQNTTENKEKGCCK